MITLGFVQEALEPMRERGLDVLPVLRMAGITPSELARPQGYVTADQYGALWLGIADALRDEYFGFGARAMRPGSFTMIGRAVRDSPDLERALRRTLRFLTLIIDEPRGVLTVEDGLAIITLHETSPARSAFAYRAYWIVLHGLACWLVGRRLPLRRVDFRGPEPQSGSDYRLFFGAPVTFDCARSVLAFDARFLRLPVNRTEAALKEFLRRAPANILIRYRYDSGLNADVRARLNGMPPALWPDFEGMAKILRVPPSTLRRKLRREGEGYAEIKDELRRELAFTALASTDRRIGDIAADLGFAEPSAFHRAFRKWTELTPDAYRRQKRADGQPSF
ncbi:MAG: AraC family transcriptional regulator [Pseudochelatococcus sp.]|jgi:AraC-like DNA-binding protein|uniref:AraC family transcriptional regulator n=1 Tax=Pseudochelatococcus sp. TaxID=2020869 RepID=UPI003D917C3F